MIFHPRAGCFSPCAVRGRMQDMDSQYSFNGGGVPNVFQFMPRGTSVIHASVNGKPGTREVVVDASAAERLQRDLEEKFAAAHAGQKARPCGLFDHKDGEACLIPKRFYWDDDKGVMLEADWTQAGKAAVEGRNYSYWSPCFRLGRDGRVVGLTGGVEVGSLVNNPAFETIARIAAAKAEVDEPADDVVDVNGGAVEVDAAHCNQYQHVPGCPHENEGGGNKSWQRQSKVRKAIQSGDDDAAEKAVVEVIEDAKKDGDETGARFWKDMLDSMRREREEKKRMKEVLERAHRRNSDNVKSSKPEDAEPEDEKELSLLKRAHLAALEKWRKRKERKAAKDADLQDVRERVRLAAACGKCKPAIENVRERVKAANPYGCNQYGHGFKREHEGYGAGGQKTLEFDGTDKEYQERKKAFEEAVQKRKERDRKSAERREAEIKKYGLESKREKYERMARERDEKHAAAVKKAEDALRDNEDEQHAVWRRGENDEWTDALTKKKDALEKQEKALRKKLDDAKRKQQDWEGKKKRNWEYDKKWGTSTLFR